MSTHRYELRDNEWQAIYARFRLWKMQGIFEAIFTTLNIDADFLKIYP